ncbi:unnamed protein product, partial [Mesorhabditis spiculigera]
MIDSSAAHKSGNFADTKIIFVQPPAQQSQGCCGKGRAMNGAFMAANPAGALINAAIRRAMRGRHEKRRAQELAKQHQELERYVAQEREVIQVEKCPFAECQVVDAHFHEMPAEKDDPPPPYEAKSI